MDTQVAGCDYLISSASVRSITVSVLYRAHLCMKYSLGISNFLEEISSLSHSIVFLYFFALIAEEGFLRDSEDSSPIEQFKSYNSLAFGFLYHPTLTSIHDYWEKTTALTIWTFVGKLLSLLLNMLSRLVITFLPRSKHLLISWLQSPFAVILEPPKTKSVTVSIVSPSICHEVMGPDAMILVS